MTLPIIAGGCPEKKHRLYNSQNLPEEHNIDKEHRDTFPDADLVIHGDKKCCQCRQHQEGQSNSEGCWANIEITKERWNTRNQCNVENIRSEHIPNSHPMITQANSRNRRQDFGQ